jgi:hypothetical protein
MNRSTHNTVEIVRITLDSLVLIVMVFALYAAFKANGTSRQSLTAQYVPWVGIGDVSCELANGTITVHYTVRSFSNTPALNIDVDCELAGLHTPPRAPHSMSLLPQDTAQTDFTLNNNSNPDGIYQSMVTGSTPVTFTINYDDIFQHHYSCLQEVRFTGTKGRVRHYSISGMETIAK